VLTSPASPEDDLRDADRPPNRLVSALRQWRSFVPAGPILALQITLVLAFAVQSFVLGPYAYLLGVSGRGLAAGHWWTLISSLFIHAGLVHLAMNMASLPIGGPVLRHLGRQPSGVVLFFVLYFTCGLAGELVYVGLHPMGAQPVVGASGAIFGLWGAMSRVEEGDGKVAPLFSADVRRHAVAAVRDNLFVIALMFVMSLSSGRGGMLLAWEAHAGGFIAGLLLIAPLDRLAKRLR
jgi:membrane associated rhomboid family serine protease